MEPSVRQRAVESLARHAPELAEVPVTELGQGLDHSAFLAGDLVLRVGDGELLTREARLLDVVAGRVCLPVPTIRFVDATNGVAAYPLLPGRPLLGRVPPPGVAPVLGRFLRELHAVDAADVAHLVPTEDADPVAWLEELEGPADLLDLVRSTVPAPTDERVLTHSDLGAEHVLEHDGMVTGVIDWSDASLADPALDLARLYRDVGPDFLSEVLDAYGTVDGPSSMDRVVFFARCAALEDLAYGRATGRQEYARAAERSIAWLFKPS